MSDQSSAEKTSLFSFANISKYYLIPLIAPIVCVINDYIYKSIIKYSGNYDKTNIYFFILYYTPKIIGGLFHFCYVSKKEERVTRSSIESKKERIKVIKGNTVITDEVQVLSDKIEKERFTKAFKFTVFSSFLDLLSEGYFLLNKDETLFDKRLFYLFLVSYISLKILKKDVFIHQKISLIIAIIGLLVVYLSTIIFSDINNWPLKLLIEFFLSILNVTSLVLSKYIMEKLFMPPLLYMLFTGVFSLIFGFFHNIIYLLLKGKNPIEFFQNFPYFFNENNLKECIIFLILIFFSVTVYNILKILTINIFSPTLLIISDLLSPFITLIINEINEGEKGFVMSFIGYVIAILASVFYNELIICNFWGLNINTAENIKKRVDKEKGLIKEEENRESTASEKSYNNEEMEENCCEKNKTLNDDEQ